MDSDFVNNFRRPQQVSNPILNLHPFVKLNLMLVLCILNFLLRNLYFSASLCVTALLIALLAGCFLSFFKLYWKVFLFFGIFWFFFKASFSGGENVLFQFAGIKITSEGIQTGLRSSFLVLGFSGIFLLFFQLTPMSKLMLAFENIGLSRSASFVFLSTFQSIQDLSVNARVIMESQKSRGIETEGNVFVRLKAYIPVLGPLVLNAVASTEEKVIAMEARAFSAMRHSSHLCELPRAGAAQIALIIICNLTLVLSVVDKFFTKVFL